MTCLIAPYTSDIIKAENPFTFRILEFENMWRNDGTGYSVAIEKEGNI